MLTADLAPEQLIVRSLTGVRQRVILVVLATVLALATQSSQGGLPPTGADGDLDITVEIGGERLGFTCRGSGHTTVLLLASDETAAGSFWHDAETGAAAITRVCALDLTGVDLRATWLTAAGVSRITTELNALLAGEQVPAPYVLVATVAMEPVTTQVAEHSGDLVNGTLLIDAERQPMIGWIAEGGKAPRAVTLVSAEQLLLAIRSLVWPAAEMRVS